MPYLVTTSKYPSDKIPEAVEKYLEVLKKYPTDENLWTELVPAAVKATPEGISTFVVMEVKEGKLDEAYKKSVQFMLSFQGIKGYEYSIDVYLTVVEALGMLGMAPPD